MAAIKTRPKPPRRPSGKGNDFGQEPLAPTQGQMEADLFNVVHARVALGDGPGRVSDPTAVREKLFEIVANYGWENATRLLASCARLFAEVPAPGGPFPQAGKDSLHNFAADMESHRRSLRAVDRTAQALAKDARKESRR